MGYRRTDVSFFRLWGIWVYDCVRIFEAEELLQKVDRILINI